MLERLLADVAHDALFGPEVRLLSDFPDVCAENDTSFLVVDPYVLNSGFASQGVDRLRDVFQAVAQHTLAHGSQKQCVSASGRENYFLHNVPSIGPDNESGKRNEHNCADKQKQGEEPEGE
jgi:hypothetical protein